MSLAMGNQTAENNPFQQEKQRKPLKWLERGPESRLANDWKSIYPDQRVTRAGKVPERSTQSHELAHIVEAIKASEWILELEENWNGEGAGIVLRVTWERAKRFLTNYVVRSWERFGVIVDAPKILPGPDGSIDLHWKTEDYELLVNIPADPEKLAEFYGDDYGNAHIKGSFDPTGYNLGLLSWLSDHC